MVRIMNQIAFLVMPHHMGACSFFIISTGIHIHHITATMGGIRKMGGQTILALYQWFALCVLFSLTMVF